MLELVQDGGLCAPTANLHTRLNLGLVDVKQEIAIPTEKLVPSGTLRERYRLRESELAQEQSILLPLFHQMTEQEQDYVSKVFKANGVNP